MPQQEKFEPAYLAEGLAATAQQIQAARGELVVGPETVIPVMPDDLDEATWQSDLTQLADELGVSCSAHPADSDIL